MTQEELKVILKKHYTKGQINEAFDAFEGAPEPDKLLQSGIDIRNTTEYTKDSRKPGNKENKSE